MEPKLIFDAPIVGKKKIWVKEQYIPYFEHPLHYHLVSEITWIKKGHGKLIMGDRVCNFSEGDVVFEPEHFPHLWKSAPSFYEEKKTQNTQAIEIYYQSSLISQITDDDVTLLLYDTFLSKANRGVRFYGKTRSSIIELMQKVMVSNRLERLGHFLGIIEIIINSNEYECLASPNYKVINDDLDLERFDRVYQYLLDNFQNDVTLEDAASLCYLTPNSFCRFFKSRTQKTFTQFLNELRIGHACKLLQADTDSVLNICYKCGYRSPVNFFKFFKQITGQTPKEYRDHFNRLSS